MSWSRHSDVSWGYNGESALFTDGPRAARTYTNETKKDQLIYSWHTRLGTGHEDYIFKSVNYKGESKEFVSDAQGDGSAFQVVATAVGSDGVECTSSAAILTAADGTTSTLASPVTIANKVTSTAYTDYYKGTAVTCYNSNKDEVLEYNFIFDTPVFVAAGATATMYLDFNKDTNKAPVAIQYANTDGGEVQDLDAVEYTITYNSNGYTCPNLPEAQIKPYNSSVSLSSIIPVISDSSKTDRFKITLDPNGGTCSKTSYTEEVDVAYEFAYWSTQPGDRGYWYFPGEEYNENKNLTLYLHIHEVNKLPTEIRIPTPTRTGYNFKSWQCTTVHQTFLTEVISQADSYGKLSTPIDIKYFINYDNSITENGETGAITHIGYAYNDDGIGTPALYLKYENGLGTHHDIPFFYSGSISYGGKTYDEWIVTNLTELGAREGIGFYTDTITTATLTHSYLQDIIPYGDCTFVAQWEAATKYTITYNLEGGTGVFLPQEKLQDETVTLSGKIPLKQGYEFLNWTGLLASGVQKLYHPGDSYSENQDIELHAVWKAASVVYIDSGTSFQPYTIWIDNGTGWDQYIAYIDNGTGWQLLSG